MKNEIIIKTPEDILKYSKVDAMEEFCYGGRHAVKYDKLLKVNDDIIDNMTRKQLQELLNNIIELGWHGEEFILITKAFEYDGNKIQYFITFSDEHVDFDELYRLGGHITRVGYAQETLVKTDVIIRNFTPHKVTVCEDENNVINSFESEGIARAEQIDVLQCHLNGIPVVVSKFGEPIGLPKPEENTYYIVSLITANAAKAAGRTTEDLLLTSTPVRNETGQIIGCKALAVVK